MDPYLSKWLFDLRPTLRVSKSLLTASHPQLQLIGLNQIDPRQQHIDARGRALISLLEVLLKYNHYEIPKQDRLLSSHGYLRA